MSKFLSRLFSKAAQFALSIIPNWLAGIRWYINDKFLTLVGEGYRQNSIVYACIQLLAKSVPEAPLRIYREEDGTAVPIDDHPAQKLIRSPNPLQTEFEFWELVMIQLSCVGRSHWWKKRNNIGDVTELWPLRPDRVSPVYQYGADGPQFGWDYDLDGWVTRIPRQDVLTFNYPKPDDASGGVVEGLGPLQILAREVDTDNAATRFVYALVSNYAMPGVIVTTKSKLKPDDALQLKEEFKRRYGSMHLGEPAVIDDDTKVEKFSFSLTDLEFPQMRAISESRIAAGFGVPPILVGLKAGLDRATYSNAEQAERFFTLKTLSAIWRRLQDQYQADIVAEFAEEALVARFDTSKVRILQQEQAARYADALKLGAATRNEYRTLGLGIPAVPDGDCYLLPSGVSEQPARDSLDAVVPKPDERKRLLKAAGRAIDWTDSGIEALAQTTVEDVAAARRWYRLAVPERAAGLLDATTR